MDNDNYIDSLQVQLKLHSTPSPLKAKDEADAIVDGHVVPAVESVMEEMGAGLDENIPQLEIDVGRVRLQDLREAVESALREALREYRVSKAGSPPTTLSAQSFREFVGTGRAPWEIGDVPFDPSVIVTEVLENDPDTVFSSVETFSEKELASLLMAIFEITNPEILFKGLGAGRNVGRRDDRPSVGASDEHALPPVLRLRDSILDRLIRDFPETASVLTARLQLWHAYRTLAGSSSGSSRLTEDYPAVSGPESESEDAIHDVDTAQPPYFQYVEIDRKDVPGGYPIEVMDYKERPDASDPEYIQSKEIPSKYYRKITVPSLEMKHHDDSAGIRTETTFRREEEVVGSMEEDTLSVGSSYRYVEISLKDIPEGIALVTMAFRENPDKDAPEYIMSVGTPLKYYRKVAVGSVEEHAAMALAETGKDEEAREAQEAEAGVDRRDSEPLKALKDQADVLEPASTPDFGSDASSSVGPEGEETPRTYRYVEISLEDIPEGYPVEMADYVEKPGKDDPEYIMSFGTPSKYYRKVVVDSLEELATTGEEKADIAEGTLDSGGETTGLEEETRANRDETLVNRRKTDSNEGKGFGTKAEELDIKTTIAPYRYVSIDRSDIPEGYPVVTMGFKESPGENDPDFIAVPGLPEGFFRKIAVGAGTVSESLENQGDQGRQGVASGSGVPEIPEFQDMPEIWEIQAFESEVAEDRYPVSDAGLVLLHPFFGRMMENLGLVEDGAFVSPLAQIRAVHLLRDLTMSDEPHYNHNLIMEKVLCGLPVGYAVPPEWQPAEKEKEEMKALLQAVCEYWRPLSGSSAEALCGTFIRRPGAIERFEDSWIIRVEGNTIDILLDDLPWELSVIYLPWLDAPLAVEWQRE